MAFFRLNYPIFFFLLPDNEIDEVINAWARVSPRQSLTPIRPSKLEHLLSTESDPIQLALSPSRRDDPNLSGLIELLEVQDPRFVQTFSIVSLLRSTRNEYLQHYFRILL